MLEGGFGIVAIGKGDIVEFDACAAEAIEHRGCMRVEPVFERRLGEGLAIGGRGCPFRRGRAEGRFPGLSRIERAMRLRRIDDGRNRLEHLVDALGRYIGPRQEDEDDADHHERHDDDHGIRDERDHVAGLDGAVVDVRSSHPHDQNRNGVHDKHDRRLKQRHRPIREQLRIAQLARCRSESFLFVCAPSERPHDQNARKHLARDEVHAIDELLHAAELGHGDRKDDGEHHGDDDDSKHDDPAHGKIRAGNHDDAADREDRRIEHHAQHDDEHHLDLLDVVRAARDERRGGEAVDFGIRERNDLLEQGAAHIACDLRGRARCDEGDEYRGDHHDGGHAEHARTDRDERVHLHRIGIVPERPILGDGRLDALLSDDLGECIVVQIGELRKAGTAAVGRIGRLLHGVLDIPLRQSARIVGLAHPGKPIGVESCDGAVFGHRDDEQRKAQGVVEIGAVRAAVRVKFPGSCIGFVIRGFDQGFIVLACEHRGETAGRIAHLGRARVLDAGLLDADVDDVRRQSRQGQIGERLHDEQRGDGEHGRNRMPQIAEYAHMTSFPCAHVMFPAHAPCRRAVGIDAAAHAPF